MRMQAHPDAAPGQLQVRMVAFTFSNLTDAISELQGLLEVLEAELFHQMVIVNHLPVPTEFILESFQFLTCQRRHATSAGNTRFAREIAHERSFLSLRYCLQHGA